MGHLVDLLQTCILPKRGVLNKPVWAGILQCRRAYELSNANAIVRSSAARRCRTLRSCLAQRISPEPSKRCLEPVTALLDCSVLIPTSANVLFSATFYHCSYCFAIICCWISPNIGLHDSTSFKIVFIIHFEHHLMSQHTSTCHTSANKITMGPSLTADFNAMIKWSLDSKRSNAEFTERLGLPQAEASKHKIGQPKFEGKAADLCMKLYKSTNAAVKSLKGRYPTVSDLKSAIYQQDELSIARITGPLLREHGPDIWSSFEPYATRLGLAKYPRRLEYFNDTHRERSVKAKA
jgi:hypothetical protein